MTYSSTRLLFLFYLRGEVLNVARVVEGRRGDGREHFEVLSVVLEGLFPDVRPGRQEVVVALLRLRPVDAELALLDGARARPVHGDVALEHRAVVVGPPAARLDSLMKSCFGIPGREQISTSGAVKLTMR